MGKTLDLIRFLGTQLNNTASTDRTRQGPPSPARTPATAGPQATATSRATPSSSYSAPTTQASWPTQGVPPITTGAITVGTQLRFSPQEAWSTFVLEGGKTELQQESAQPHKTFDLKIEGTLPSRDSRIQQYMATYVENPTSPGATRESVTVTGTHHNNGQTYFSARLASGAFITFQVKDGQSGRGQFTFRKDTQQFEEGRPLQHLHGFRGDFDIAP